MNEKEEKEIREEYSKLVYKLGCCLPFFDDIIQGKDTGNWELYHYLEHANIEEAKKIIKRIESLRKKILIDHGQHGVFFTPDDQNEI